jgi:hypothetical protein
VLPNATYRCDVADWQHWVVDPSQRGTVKVGRYLLSNRPSCMWPFAGPYLRASGDVHVIVTTRRNNQA